jgi:hypothetical protein
MEGVYRGKTIELLNLIILNSMKSTPRHIFPVRFRESPYGQVVLVPFRGATIRWGRPPVPRFWTSPERSNAQ